MFNLGLHFQNLGLTKTKVLLNLGSKKGCNSVYRMNYLIPMDFRSKLIQMSLYFMKSDVILKILLFLFLLLKILPLDYNHLTITIIE